jgi:hypothetical protein
MSLLPEKKKGFAKAPLPPASSRGKIGGWQETIASVEGPADEGDKRSSRGAMSTKIGLDSESAEDEFDAIFREVVYTTLFLFFGVLLFHSTMN